MDQTTELPTISLSKNGKNVIILMLDRALGTQVPYIFNEKPELKEKFDGFTYYPNTISYGSCTINGAPSLFGGYEYTPEKINERSSESLAAKHNEALKVMPVLFGNNGFNVTICNPPFAGYKIISDLSIYNDHPDFHVYTTAESFSVLDWGNDDDTSVNVLERVNYIRNRNFFFFSLMKVSPLILQETIYDGGIYNEPIIASENSSDNSAYSYALVQTTYGNSKSSGYNLRFIKEYVVLDNLSKFTTVKNDNENTFFIMDSDITHNPCILQEPDYVPSVRVDNTKYDVDMVSRYTLDGVTMKMNDLLQVRHYHVNMAAYLKLGEWFDYLRKNGVYDNTRIILVSDHGLEVEQFDVTCNNQNLECFMPLLMVKDFNAKGFSVSKEYMTNADTPSLATAGLIPNAANPFTNKAFTSEAKEGAQNVFYTASWNPEDLQGNTFPIGAWYSLNGNPHVSNNWKYIGKH